MKIFLFAIFISLINILGSHNLASAVDQVCSASAVAVENYSDEASTLGSNEDDFEDSVDLAEATRFRTIEDLRAISEQPKHDDISHDKHLSERDTPDAKMDDDIFDSNVLIDQAVPIAQEDESQQLKNDFSKLQALGVKLQGSTLEELESGDCDVLPMINPCEDLNLARLTVAILSKILEAKEGKYAIADALVRQKISVLVGSFNQLIEQSKAFGAIDFNDQQSSNIYSEVMAKLNELIDIQRQNEVNIRVQSETSVSSCCFYIKKFMELMYKRFAAEAILVQYRAALNAVQQKNSSASAKLTFNIPMPVSFLSVGAGASSVSTTASSDLSYLTSTTTRGLFLNASVGFGCLSANANFKYEQIVALIMFSLEGYLDNLNGNGKNKGIRMSSDMQSAAHSRKVLQSFEQEVVLYCGSFEKILKALGVIPDSIYLQWVVVTKSTTGMKEKGWRVGGGIGAKAKFGKASADVSISAVTGTKCYYGPIPMMDLVDKDFRPADGMDIKIFMQKINCKSPITVTKSGQAITLPLLCCYLKGYIDAIVAIPRIMMHIKNYEASKKAIKFSDKNYKERKKDIESSIKTLNIKKKELSDLKHRTEKELCVRDLQLKGRVGLGVSVLGAAVHLCHFNPSVCEAAHKRLLYELLKRLILLEIYSKNKNGIRKAFNWGTKSTLEKPVKAKVNSIVCSAGISIPTFVVVGNPRSFNSSIVYMRIDGSPFLYENYPSIKMEIDLPLGLGGMPIVQAIQRKYTKALKSKKLPFELEDFGNALADGFICTSLQSALSALGFAGYTGGVDNRVKCTFTFIYYGKNAKLQGGEVVPISENYVPLPLMRKPILHTKGMWVMTCVTYTYLMGTKQGVKVGGNSLEVAISQGSRSKTLSSDSMYEILAKWPAHRIGETDSVSGKGNGVKDKFIDGNAKKLIEMFSAIAYDGTVSYETQMLYNDMLKNAKNEKERTEFEALMQKFMAWSFRLSGLMKEGTPMGTMEYMPYAKMPKRAEVTEERLAKSQECINLFKMILETFFVNVFFKHYSSVRKMAA